MSEIRYAENRFLLRKRFKDKTGKDPMKNKDEYISYTEDALIQMTHLLNRTIKLFTDDV